eukprot:Gb_13064 [translate_table: standard]
MLNLPIIHALCNVYGRGVIASELVTAWIEKMQLVVKWLETEGRSVLVEALKNSVMDSLHGQETNPHKEKEAEEVKRKKGKGIADENGIHSILHKHNSNAKQGRSYYSCLHGQKASWKDLYILITRIDGKCLRTDYLRKSARWKTMRCVKQKQMKETEIRLKQIVEQLERVQDVLKAEQQELHFSEQKGAEYSSFDQNFLERECSSLVLGEMLTAKVHRLLDFSSAFARVCTLFAGVYTSFIGSHDNRLPNLKHSSHHGQWIQPLFSKCRVVGESSSPAVRLPRFSVDCVAVRSIQSATIQLTSTIVVPAETL